jgi:EmrB/QacA subfamily drug resistance transporter
VKAIPRSLCDDEKHEQSRVTNLAPNLQPFATDARPPLAESSRRLLPWLIAVAFFMESLDTTILSTGVPAIAAALHVGPLSMKSVLASYTLSLAVFIPISGWMADRFGTRRVFASAIAIFTLGSFLCGISNNIHLLVACRVIQGCGGAMMVPVGRLTMVRTFAKADLIRAMSFVVIPALIGPMLGPIAGGLIVDYFHWRYIFFVNIPIGLVGLYMSYRHLPDFREAHSNPLDLTGLFLFGSGIAMLSYVLEIFGEHTLGTGAIVGLLVLSMLLLTAYGFHATRAAYPLLRLTLFRIRTFRAAVVGGFVTRLGIGGIPFLFPLLYQVGLGFTPIQSGLLMMPQAVSAMSLKLATPWILARFGYRAVLVSNTVAIGLMIMVFAAIGKGTPVWQIVLEMFFFGFLTSLQYTSMNTLVYAEVNDEQASSASSIAATMQQMSISFGVASASLVTAMFLPSRYLFNPMQFIYGIHRAFFVLGGLTLLSTLVFCDMKRGDGDTISQGSRPQPSV